MRTGHWRGGEVGGDREEGNEERQRDSKRYKSGRKYKVHLDGHKTYKCTLYLRPG